MQVLAQPQYAEYSPALDEDDPTRFTHVHQYSAATLYDFS
jgi:hypothetical protein